MAAKAQGVVWDLTSFFPSFNGPEMLAFKKKLAADIAALQKKAAKLAPLSAKTANEWEKIILASEDIETRLGHIMTYVECLESADAKNDNYGKERAALLTLAAEYSKYAVDQLRALKDTPEKVFSSFIKREKLAPIAYSIVRAREAARRTMSPAEEKLAADLSVSGFHTWSALYDKLSSKLEFEMAWPDGKKEKLPISRWRSLMSDADRKVGRAAFEGGNKAWESIEDSCAAALNAIAGTRLTLYRHRGIKDFLDDPLFAARIQRKTIEAMYKAIHENIEIPRAILRAKAASMGRKGIYFFEREAPLPVKESKLFTWDEGYAKVSQSFDSVYPAMGAYYKDFIGKKWMESQTRGGKRPGAFCTGSAVTGEQRVYMTFNGSLGDVTTMAHEMGHAWHSHLLKDMRPAAQNYPMTLAETASIFGEHILAEGVYGDKSISETQKLLMLDEYLCGAATLLLDITVRFEFEKAFHEERKNGEVSVSRMKELMTQTQRRVFGDSLAAGGEDPMFWASKLHFYFTSVPFYNFPYTFGFLLAASLFARFKEEGQSFLPKYEDFLRLTGSAGAEEVARRSIGADLGKPDFWATAILGLKEPLARYKKLLKA